MSDQSVFASATHYGHRVSLRDLAEIVAFFLASVLCPTISLLCAVLFFCTQFLSVWTSGTYHVCHGGPFVFFVECNRICPLLHSVMSTVHRFFAHFSSHCVVALTLSSRKTYTIESVQMRCIPKFKHFFVFLFCDVIRILRGFCWGRRDCSKKSWSCVHRTDKDL